MIGESGEEGVWIDEPLPRIPLEVRPVTVMVTISGNGRPRFKTEILTSIRNEEKETVEETVWIFVKGPTEAKRKVTE